jgi:hypothetical protein
MPGHVAYDLQAANAGELICANRKARGYGGQPLGYSQAKIFYLGALSGHL